MADQNKKQQAKKQTRQSAPAPSTRQKPESVGDIFMNLIDQVSGMFKNEKKPSTLDQYTPLFMKDALKPKSEPAAKKPAMVEGYDYPDYPGPSETSYSLASIGIMPEWAPFNEQGLDPYGGIKSPPTKQALQEVNKQLAKFKYLKDAIEVGKQQGINPLVLAGLAKQESAWNPKAVSRDKKGNPVAYGLTQFKPGTFEQYYPGEDGDIFNPRHSLMASANYLNYLNETQPNEIYALRAYNQGPTNQRNYPTGTGPQSHLYPYEVADKAIGVGYMPPGGYDYIVPFKYRIPENWMDVALGDIRAPFGKPTKKKQESEGKK